MIHLIRQYAHWLHTRWPAGTVEKLPQVNADGSTRVSGLFVVGDLTGVPLLKLAADSGARAVRTILADRTFRARRRESGEDANAAVLDLVIVGAGVSGMAAALEALGDEEGRRIGTRVFKPEEVYREVNNIPPDMIVYFGDLDWRSAGSVGVGSVHLRENDTGPDDANHLPDGVFVWDPGDAGPPRKAERYQIYDVAPSILRFFGLEVPEDMIGDAII